MLVPSSGEKTRRRAALDSHHFEMQKSHAFPVLAIDRTTNIIKSISESAHSHKSNVTCKIRRPSPQCAVIAFCMLIS